VCSTKSCHDQSGTSHQESINYWDWPLMDPEMFVDGNESMPFLLEPIIELIIASKNTL